MAAVLDAINTFFKLGGWVPVLLMHCYLDICHKPRMERGKYRKWARRRFPNMGHMAIYWCLFLAILSTSFWVDSRWPANCFWIYLIVTDTIDFITGGEDPPWRKWAKSLSERIKLVIQPPPRPAIDLGRLP